MVQFINRAPEKPSTAERFNEAIGRGLESINKTQEQRARQLELQQQNQNISNLFGQDVANLPPEIQKNYINELMQLERAKELQKQKFEYDSALQGNKLRGEEQELKQVKDTAQKAFNTMADLIPSLGVGTGVKSLFGGKTAEKSGQFTSASGALESILVEMVNKGTLSNSRFKYITETLLPKPTDTQAMIRGKMKGLAEILGLDPSALTQQGIKKSKTQVQPGLYSGSKQSLQDIWK